MRKWLPDRLQVAKAIVAAGDFGVEVPDRSQVTPLAPHRSRPAGRRTFFLTGGEFPLQLDLILYQSASSARARALWGEAGILRVYRDQATNVVDRDPEEVSKRSQRWRFSLEGSEPEEAVGMCLAGWEARGLDGCDLAVWSVTFCSWTLDIGLAFSYPTEVDAAEVLTRVEALVRDEVGCR